MIRADRLSLKAPVMVMVSVCGIGASNFHAKCVPIFSANTVRSYHGKIVFESKMGRREGR